MGRLGIDDLEDLSPTRLGSDGVEELLEAATECVLSFTDDRGWPRAVVVSFRRISGAFWFAAVSTRLHVRSLRSRPQVSVVVSSAGTALVGRRMVALRGLATVHDRPEVIDRVLAQLAERLAPADPAAMHRLLASPNRVVVEIRPVAVSVSHDSRKIVGDGRGGQE